MNAVNVQQWKEMFSEIGLTEDAMDRWHRLFEKRHPEAHESFLAWLGLNRTEIEKIRAQYK